MKKTPTSRRSLRRVNFASRRLIRSTRFKSAVSVLIFELGSFRATATLSRAPDPLPHPNQPHMTISLSRQSLSRQKGTMPPKTDDPAVRHLVCVVQLAGAALFRRLFRPAKIIVDSIFNKLPLAILQGQSKCGEGLHHSDKSKLSRVPLRPRPGSPINRAVASRRMYPAALSCLWRRPANRRKRLSRPTRSF